MNKEDLELDISNALDKWDEHSMFTIAGVKDLSRSDIDTLSVCCDYYDQHGSLKGLGYFPIGVRIVLTRYGML